jgi:acetyltransferase-like isoleucine patch superfamily enzyme
MASLFLGLMARLEYHLWADTHERYQLCRRLHLRLMAVRHGEHVYCGPHILIRMRGGVSLGERCALGYSTQLWNYAAIKIGADFMAAPGLMITTGGHDPLTLKDVSAPVTIGDRCWCGANVTILAGVRIGDDVVIAAGSVVHRDIPSNTVVGGVPARQIKNLQRDAHLYEHRVWHK